MHILLSLLGLSCAELHGNMSQALRLDALRRFSEAGDERVRSTGDDLIPPGHDASDSGSPNLTKVPSVDILLATDLAARGLDIPNVQTVLNYTLPQTMKKYVHRVGRTARAANSGRAVSLVGEGDRKLLKQIMKEAPYPVQSRVVPSEVVARFRAKLAKLDPVVEEILVRESEERELRSAQAQLQKAEDLISKGPSSKQTAASTRQRVDWFADRKKKQKVEPLSNRTMKSAKRKLRQSSDSD
ncbi:unnamed protein product [Dicrocoelium dendriticum]|nr:unnamed protein product [Dicrocoelium dendriticum]